MIHIRMTPERLEQLRKICQMKDNQSPEIQHFFKDIEDVIDDWNDMIAWLDELTGEV